MLLNMLIINVLLWFCAIVSIQGKISRGIKNPMNGTCEYRVNNDEKVTISKANTTCINLGGSLAMMKTNEIQDFVESQIIDQYGSDGGTIEFWIGGYKPNNKWLWFDGTTITEGKWAWSGIGRRNGYLLMTSYRTSRDAMKWFVTDDTSKKGGYVCEVPVFELCSRFLCLNMGTCYTIGCQKSCECATGFYGDSCENKAITIIRSNSSHDYKSLSCTFDGLPSPNIYWKLQHKGSTIEIQSNIPGSIFQTTEVVKSTNKMAQITSTLHIKLVELLGTTSVYCFANNSYETSHGRKFNINPDLYIEDNSVYQIFWKSGEEKSKKNAQRHCRTLGGNLAKITNSKTQNALSDKLKAIGAEVNVYIGGSRTIQDNTIQWKWQDDTFLYNETKNGKWKECEERIVDRSYVGWLNGEPNDITFDCLKMSSSNEWFWKNVQCDEKLGYICESSVPGMLSNVEIEKCNTGIKITFSTQHEAIGVMHRFEISESNTRHRIQRQEIVLEHMSNSIIINNLKNSTNYQLKIFVCPQECIYPSMKEYNVTISSSAVICSIDDKNSTGNDQDDLLTILLSTFLAIFILFFVFTTVCLGLKLRSRDVNRNREETISNAAHHPYQTAYIGKENVSGTENDEDNHIAPVNPYAYENSLSLNIDRKAGKSSQYETAILPAANTPYAVTYEEVNVLK